MSKKIFFLFTIILLIGISISLPFPFPSLKQKLIRMLQDDDEDYSPEKFNSSNSLVLFNLYDQFNKYFQVNNSDINTRECRDFIFNDLVLDYHYNNLYYYSGHKLTDIGYATDCLDNNYTYVLPLFTFNINEK